MAKSFAPRVAKRYKRKIDPSVALGRNVFESSDNKLLSGAKLHEIDLKDVVVKDQVRTKFNDSSLRELAENIRANGLIQPLVLHKRGGQYTLICGERRFRAMGLVGMQRCPCFVLEDKTEEELMAIQFSENTAREELHYVDRAQGIYHYQRATGASERKIVQALGISKSEVHRGLLIAKLPERIKRAAKAFNIEKYVLLEYLALAPGPKKARAKEMIICGELAKRAEFRRLLAATFRGKPRRSYPTV